MSKRAISDDEALLDVSGTGSTGGEPKKVERFELAGASVQVVLSGGSYRLQASNDMAAWDNVDGGAITSSGLITLSANYRYLRVFTSTAGDGVFTLFAHELLY